MKKVNIKAQQEKRKVLPLVMVLADKIIEELGFVEVINAQVEWNKEHWLISPGHLLKMLILSTFFDIRVPLTHLKERFDGIDIRYFIGDETKSDYINSTNVGRALERLGESDYNTQYETLALTAMQQNKIPAERLHADTTTISFYGEYDECTVDLTEEEKEMMLKIERGYNKDGRPTSKQVVVGQIVNEFGIPLVSRTMDGSTSDVEWNKKAVQYFEQIQQNGFSQGIFVADSKLVVEELITTMNNQQIHYVSRCPSSFHEKLEERMIKKAYKANNWEAIGKFRERKSASDYKGMSFIETVCGQPVRLLVLESSSLVEKSEESLEKIRAKLDAPIKALKKKKFMCLADAEEEISRFKASQKNNLFICECEIKKETTQKWPRGRKGSKTQPKQLESYTIDVASVSRNESACTDFLHRESSFVLISNVTDNMSNRELLQTYKGQQVVENSFRLLKSPSMASVIYLKNQSRIKALAMILTFSLLIRAIIQFRLREGLKTFKEENPNLKLNVGWNNRPLENPTFKLLFEHSVNCCFERVNDSEYDFSWSTVETKQRVATLLDLMGLKVETLLN